MLQALSTNSLFGIANIVYPQSSLTSPQNTGKLEGTMMKKFCQGGKLLSLIADKKYAEFLEPIANRIRVFLASNYEGTLLAENDAHSAPGWSIPETKRKSAGLNEEERRVLSDAGLDRPRCLPSVLRNGNEVYQSMDTSTGNSGIIYASTPRKAMTAGRIIRVVQGENDTIKVIVRPFGELNDEERGIDPFRRYPELQAALYRKELEDELEVISLGEWNESLIRLRSLNSVFQRISGGT